ncbi:leucine-rich repeat (LRR) protein [Clostridium sp. CAG:302]|nr:leucine-rich repeat (LRR) protein [Clostridium sp. CAG:302]
MKKLSNKGFTLIELLATILIIGLVLGLTTYGIISSVKSAKDEGSKLTLAGIKEAARTYSNEYTDDTWKASNKLNNIYFCTTIQELINKGLLDKNAKNVEGNTIGLNDYIAVVKDKTTKVIKKEFVLALQAFNEDEEKHEAHQYCTGNIKPEDIKKLPIINKKNTYTDTIIAEFTDAEFKTKDGNVSNIKKRECLYDETTSGNFTSKGTITNKECKIEGLVQNKNYYVKVCMTSKNDSRACSTPEIVKTKEVKSPSININTNDSIKITYDDTNIIDENGNQNGNHYFKSDVNATSNKNVSTCNEEGETFSCSSDSTINITEDKWYKVDDKEVKLSYTNSGDITIAAVTRDKSGNYKSTDKNYSLYKIIFSRGTADTIGGQTNDIKKLCLVNKDETCTITSPIIKKAGYNVVGWNTDSNAMTSTWSQNTSKNINKSETYFPIVKLKTYTIKYNANGGSGAPSNQVKEHNKNITLSTSKPIRTGYTFVNWNTSSAGNGTSYSAGATYSGNSDITMYAQWRRNRVIINFSVNGGTLISTAAYSVDANGIVTKNGSNLHSMYYNDTIMSTGLPNYNNSSYLNIMRNGYEGVSGAEWKCLSGNCTKQTYSQDTNTYKASDFCDASKTDCTITLGVNWTEVSTKTMYINANIGLNCRSGSGTSYSIVTAYACGVPVKVRTKLVNDWWYEVDDKCYMSKGGTGSDGNWKDYLVDSRSKLTCPTSSGGSGGSGGDSGEGKLLNCTCNEDADCGVAGGNLINLYCDTNMKSGKTEKEGKYMCAWKNKYKPNVTHWCWTR